MVKKVKYSWKDFDKDVQKIIKYIDETNMLIQAIYAIPNGGLPLGVTLSNYFGVPLYTNNISSAIKKHSSECILIVDDISDSGKTLKSIPFIDEFVSITLFCKKGSKYIPNFFCRENNKNEWIVFAWEPENKKMKKDDTYK